MGDSIQLLLSGFLCGCYVVLGSFLGVAVQLLNILRGS